MVALLVLLLSSQLSSAQTAQTSEVQKAIDGQTMNINYGSPSWNTDSKRLDSAYIVMKDRTSGKMVQIQLEETEPDSSQFKGKFNVTLGDQDPQIFIPPKELRNPDRDYKKVFNMIQSGQLNSKPFVWKKNDKGQKLVDVYDTQEQADAVRKAYQDEVRLKEEAEQQKLVKQVQAKEQALAAAAAAQKAAMEKLALEAARRESDRVRMEQIEKQKAADREKAQKALTEKQRADRVAKAKLMAEEAMQLFNKGEFDSAELKFKESIELDPDNKSYYYKYGVTLFKNGKYNDSLVFLKMAQVEPSLELEKAYFIGLVHYRLKEYKSAKEQFAKASASTDPQIGPSSTFYLGIIQYSEENYEPAKQAFEKVLDTSEDPRMDKEAEEYIEKILRALQFKKMQEKRFTLNGTVGLSYDSNVTLSADNSSTQATDKADIRFLTGADLSYRMIYNQTHEWSLKAAANLINSSKNAISRADPWVYDLGAPYTLKTSAFGKGYVMSLKPNYEMIYMDPTSTGTKSKILSSTMLNWDNMFVNRPDYISIYTLELRMDDFTLAGSDGDNEYDATKATLKTTQMLFMDKARKEAIVGSLGYGMNLAKGKNKKFNRIEAGVTYLRPMKWGYSWNAGLTVYNLDYASSDDKRKDLNVTLTTGLDKPIRDWVSWGVMAQFTKNDSSIASTYEYSKWLVMTTATFNTIF